MQHSLLERIRANDPGVKSCVLSHKEPREIARFYDEYFSNNTHVLCIEFHHCGIDPHTIKQLTRHQTLKKLVFVGCFISTAHIEALSAVPTLNQTLTRLTLANPPGREWGKSTPFLLTAEHAETLAKCTSLVYLDLANNDIQSGIVHFRNHPTLRHLNLSGNQIQGTAVQQYIFRTTLKTLLLDDNFMGDEGAQYLAENVYLLHLSLANNNIGNLGAIALAFKTRASMLNLSDNRITSLGAIELASNPCVYEINLENNFIGNRGYRKLLKSKRLVTIRLAGNNMLALPASIFLENNIVTDLTFWSPGLRPMNRSTPSGLYRWFRTGMIHQSNRLSSHVYGFQHRHIDEHLRENQRRAETLVQDCKEKKLGAIECALLGTASVQPYGAYIRTITQDKGGGNLLHRAIPEMPSRTEKPTGHTKPAMLALLLTRVPPHEYYLENDDFLAYEELAEQNGVMLHSELRARTLLRKRWENEAQDPERVVANAYADAMCNLLILERDGARAIAGGAQPQTSTPVIAVSAGVDLASPVLGVGIRHLDHRHTRNKSKNFVSWLRSNERIESLINLLLENRAYNIESTDPAGSTWRTFLNTCREAYYRMTHTEDFTEAQRRGILHAIKLVKYMQHRSKSGNAVDDEWPLSLIREVIPTYHLSGRYAGTQGRPHGSSSTTAPLLPRYRAQIDSGGSLTVTSLPHNRSTLNPAL